MVPMDGVWVQNSRKRDIGLKKVLKVLKWVIVTLVALAVVFAIGFKIYVGNYYKTDEETVSSIASNLDNSVNSYTDDNGMVFLPEGQDYKAVIVFYPGGKVEYTAYSGLMYELADRGYICVLSRMPENLAFLKINAVEGMKNDHAEETDTVKDLDCYLAGHSLGGVAASLFLNEASDEYKGLILCASYPNADLSNMDIRFLSILGSEDKVIKKDAYDNAKAYWPKDSEEHIIDGGIHSYFGCYGIQSGDGKPTISNEEQIVKTADIIEQWIEKGAD